MYMGKIKSVIFFRSFNSKWENTKYTIDTKAICTERVTAAHTTQTRAMFWTLKHSTSYQCFSRLKKGNEKEIITHFLEAWKMLTKYCLCHISWRIFKSHEIVSGKTVRNKSFFFLKICRALTW